MNRLETVVNVGNHAMVRGRGKTQVSLLSFLLEFYNLWCPGVNRDFRNIGTITFLASCSHSLSYFLCNFGLSFEDKRTIYPRMRGC